jgi:hypothetical protein
LASRELVYLDRSISIDMTIEKESDVSVQDIVANHAYLNDSGIASSVLHTLFEEYPVDRVIWQ